jgi:hypothetical protein
VGEPGVEQAGGERGGRGVADDEPVAVQQVAGPRQQAEQPQG